MGKTKKFAACLAGAFAVFALAGTIGASDASAAPRCRAPIEGFATGTGILGQGTEKARWAARANWRAKVTDLYGARYNKFQNAEGVQWDCLKNAILLAKCVVIAKPCRY